MTGWLQIAQTFGIPVAILVALAIAFWQFSRWTGPRVDKLINRHIEFVDAVQVSMGVISGRLDDVDSSGRRTAEHLESIATRLEELVQAQKTTSHSVAELSEAVKGMAHGSRR